MEALGGFSMKLGSAASTQEMQLPRELLGLVMWELGEEAVLKAELAEGAVLMLEGEVEQVVRKAPPSFFW